MKASLRRRRRDAEKSQDDAAEDGVDFLKGKPTNLFYFLWGMCSRIFRCMLGVLPILMRPRSVNDTSSERCQQETERLVDVELGGVNGGDLARKHYHDIELGQVVDESHLENLETGKTPKTKNGGNNKIIVKKKGVLDLESGQKEDDLSKSNRVPNGEIENNAVVNVELRSQSDNDEESLQRSNSLLEDEVEKNDEALHENNKLADYTSHRADSPTTAASILDFNSTHSRRSKATTATGNPAQQLEEALSTAELLLNLPLEVEGECNGSAAVPSFIEISNSSAHSSKKLRNQSSCSSRLRLSMNNLLADQESTSRRLTDSESSLHMTARNPAELEELKRVASKPNPRLYRSRTGEPFTSSNGSINFSLRRNGSYNSREPIQRQHSSTERIRRTLSNLQMAERKERKAVEKAKIPRTAKSMDVLSAPNRTLSRSNNDGKGERYSRSKRLSTQQQSVKDEQKSSNLNAQWTPTKRAAMPKRGSFSRCSNTIEAYMQSMNNLNENIHTDWSSKPRKWAQRRISANVASELHLSQESKSGQFRRTSSMPTNGIRSRPNQRTSLFDITAALAAKESSHGQSFSAKNAQWTARPKAAKRPSLLDLGVVLAAQRQNSATTGIPSEISLSKTIKGSPFRRTSSLPASAHNLSSPSFQTITQKNLNSKTITDEAHQRSSRRHSLINIGAALSAKESLNERSSLASKNANWVSRPKVIKRRSLLDKGAALSVQTSVQAQALASANSKSTPWTPRTKPKSHPSGSKLDKLAASTIIMLNESTQPLLENSMKKKSVRKCTSTGTFKAWADKNMTKKTHTEGKHSASEGPKKGKRRVSHTNLRILAALNRETKGSSFDLSATK